MGQSYSTASIIYGGPSHGGPGAISAVIRYAVPAIEHKAGDRPLDLAREVVVVVKLVSDVIFK